MDAIDGMAPMVIFALSLRAKSCPGKVGGNFSRIHQWSFSKIKIKSSVRRNALNTHGGSRKGAGRPAGSKNRTGNEERLCLAQMARQHTRQAIEVLIDIALTGRTDAARVSAASAILDRGYGKPTASEPDRPIASTPTVIELVAGKQNEKPHC